jgi:hypothetical protein
LQQSKNGSAPSVHGDNLERLALALDDLEAARIDGQLVALKEATLRGEHVTELHTAGSSRSFPSPPAPAAASATSGEPPTREPLGRGLRRLVASIGDLARMARDPRPREGITEETQTHACHSPEVVVAFDGGEPRR